MSIRCLNIAVTDIGPAVLRRYCSVSDIGVVGAVGGGSGSTWDIYRLLIRSVHSLVGGDITYLTYLTYLLKYLRRYRSGCIWCRCWWRRHSVQQPSCTPLRLSVPASNHFRGRPRAVLPLTCTCPMSPSGNSARNWDGGRYGPSL